MIFNSLIRPAALVKSAIASCLALSIWHSPAQAAQFKGSVEQYTAPTRLARPGSAEATTSPLDGQATETKPLEGRTSASFIPPARFHCNCSAHPLKRVAGPLAPNNLGGEKDWSGRVIGQMDCGTGKHVYLDFGDVEMGQDPAWTAWLQRLKDCLDPIWASHNQLFCEFNLTAKVTPDGHIKQIEKYNYAGYSVPGQYYPEQPVILDDRGRWFAGQLIAVNDVLSLDGDNILRFPQKRNQDTKIYIWFQNKFTSP